MSVDGFFGRGGGCLKPPKLTGHGLPGRAQLTETLVRSIQKYLGHPLQRYGKWHHGVIAGRVTVRPVGAVTAEDTVARLAEQELSARVGTALGNHFSPLPRHQIEQLVDEERRR